jgi:hypothetical protein
MLPLLGFVKILIFEKNSSKLATYNDVNKLALKMLFKDGSLGGKYYRKGYPHLWNTSGKE